MTVITDKCGDCGEEIHVELNRFDCCRKDGKRPHYPDEKLPDGVDPKKYSMNNSTTFRCRKCHAFISNTAPAAEFD